MAIQRARKIVNEFLTAYSYDSVFMRQIPKEYRSEVALKGELALRSLLLKLNENSLAHGFIRELQNYLGGAPSSGLAKVVSAYENCAKDSSNSSQLFAILPSRDPCRLQSLWHWYGNRSFSR